MGLLRKLKCFGHQKKNHSPRQDEDARQTTPHENQRQQTEQALDPPPPYDFVEEPAVSPPSGAVEQSPSPEPSRASNEHDLLYHEFGTIRPDLLSNNDLAYYWAALHGHTSILQSLLQHNPLPRCLNTTRPMTSYPAEYRGWTPAQLAIANFHIPTALVLCDHGANVGSQFEETAMAMLCGHTRDRPPMTVPLVKDALRIWRPPLPHNAHLGLAASSQGGARVLNAAIREQRVEVARWLWENGARDFWLEDEDYVKTMQELIASPANNCVAYFLNHGLREGMDSAVKWQKLFWAVGSGLEEKVPSLLKEEPRFVKVRRVDGTTPLHLACEGPRRGVKYNIVRLLLHHGADVNAKSRVENRRTPLETLVDNSRSFNHKYRIDVCQLLVDHGAAVNALEPSSGAGLLHRAAYHGLPGFVKILLAYGADTQRLDNEGKTPCDVALERDHAEVAVLLGYEQAGPTESSEEQRPDAAPAQEDSANKTKQKAPVKKSVASASATATTARSHGSRETTDFATLRWE